MKQYAVPFAALCFSGLALLGCSDNDNTQAAPAGSDKSANGIAGVWQNDQHVLVLEANGDLYLPKDNSLQGLRWEQQDDTLTFNYLDNREQRVTQASATGLQQDDTLTLTRAPATPQSSATTETADPEAPAPDAETEAETESANDEATPSLFNGDYQRANQAVGHISGTVTRPEDSELPDNAVLTVALLNSQIDPDAAGAQPVAKRLIRLDKDSPTLPFRLYYLPDDLKADHDYQIISQILADGGLFYQSDAITLERNPQGFADVTLPLTAVMTDSETLRGAITRGKPGQDRDTFTLCNSDRRLLIRGPQSDDLLSAYDKGIRYPQQPRVATVSGLVRKVPGSQEGSTEAALIVESFNLEPGMENCQLPTAELTHTRWQLTHLETDRIILGSAAQVPFLTFNDDGKVKGHGSCNSLSGAYQRDGQQLALSDLASTRKACPTSAIENRYLDALKASDHFRIDGELLTLFDKDDEAVASFQSIYL